MVIKKNKKAIPGPPKLNKQNKQNGRQCLRKPVGFGIFWDHQKWSKIITEKFEAPSPNFVILGPQKSIF